MQQQYSNLIHQQLVVLSKDEAPISSMSYDCCVYEVFALRLQICRGIYCKHVALVNSFRQY